MCSEKPAQLMTKNTKETKGKYRRVTTEKSVVKITYPK